MITGRATAEGTSRYASGFPAHFYRHAGPLTVSTLGLGTYLGDPDERTDQAYTAAVIAALRGGVNFLDAAINYRNQRSERSIGAALASIEFPRTEVVVCTKAGFLTPGAVDPKTLTEEDIAGGMHAMAPDFLADQIERSRVNLGLETIDVFYLHNPETQISYVSRDTFEARIRAAFERLEQIVAQGKIGWYGTATWDGYRKPGALELPRLVEIAREMGGAEHHFRFVQLPFNLAMPEAFTQRPSVLEAAREAGITVVASASILQSRLSHGLPDQLARQFPGLETDAQRAIQFTRSTPGITVALVGMSDTGHVKENLGVAGVEPLDPEVYRRLYQNA